MTPGEQPSSDSIDAPTADQRGTIDRRAAMKAALGGAVAAAAWTAPRIDHLSVAPAFGQAASCIPTNGSISQTTSECDSNIIGFTSECYGNCADGLFGDCEDETIVYPTSGTVTGEFPQGVTMTVVWSGFAEGSLAPGQGDADITVNGIVAPQTCTMSTTQTPTCNSGSFRAQPNPITFTATSAQADQNFGCYNNLGSLRQRLTLTMTLVCTCPA